MHESVDEVTVTVAETAAEALGTSVEELPPLSEAIDLDGLESVVPQTPQGSPSDVTVAFSYAGLRVLVGPGRTVYVEPLHWEHRNRPAESHL